MIHPAGEGAQPPKSLRLCTLAALGWFNLPFMVPNPKNYPLFQNLIRCAKCLAVAKCSVVNGRAVPFGGAQQKLRKTKSENRNRKATVSMRINSLKRAALLAAAGLCSALSLLAAEPPGAEFLLKTNAGVRFAGGSFSYAYAYAFDSIPGGQAINNVGPVSYPGGISAGPIDKTGIAFTAHAEVAASVALSPFGVTTTMIPNRYITALGPLSWESAVAHASCKDPVTLDVGPGAQLTLSFLPDTGMGAAIPNTPPAAFSSSFMAYANTDIPGFASLYSLFIQMSSATPGQVGVTFSSNPLLGLNDAAIKSELESGFTYDSATGDYSFNPTGQEIDATLTVPDGVSVVNIITEIDAEVDATVPEPSTLALVSFGTLSLLTYAGWRRKAKA